MTLPCTGLRIWIGGHSRTARAAIEPLLQGSTRPTDGDIDRLIITPLEFDEFVYFVNKHQSRLVEGGEVWLISSFTDAVPIREKAAGSASFLGLSDAQTTVLSGEITLDAWRCVNKHPPPPLSS